MAKPWHNAVREWVPCKYLLLTDLHIYLLAYEGGGDGGGQGTELPCTLEAWSLRRGTCCAIYHLGNPISYLTSLRLKFLICKIVMLMSVP